MIYYVVWASIHCSHRHSNVLRLYHNAKNTQPGLRPEPSSTAQQIKDRKDVIVDLRLSNGMTLFEYYNDLVIEINQVDENLHGKGKCLFCSPKYSNRKDKKTYR